MKKRILIVSENFTKGGLETSINATAKALKDKTEYFYAVKNYDEAQGLTNLYKNFNFGYYTTVGEFCEDVQKLIEIIRKNNIDIVHVQPFYSMFPGIFAAKICKIPVVYTWHGMGSYNFPSEMNDGFLFDMLLDYELDKVFCVSLEGKKIMENVVLNKEKVIYLPNSIDMDTFNEKKQGNSKSWALISRLDIDKRECIEKFLNNMKFLDIDQLAIYGAGTESEYLENVVRKNNLEDRVFFRGHSYNLSDELDGKYCGIIGNDRVAMEGLAMGYPVILIGYRISGLIDNDIYNNVKKENFSGRNIAEVSIDTLRKQIENVYQNKYDKSFYSQFRNDYSSLSIAMNYYKEIDMINQNSFLNLEKVFEKIQEVSKEEKFYSSIQVFDKLQECFRIYIRTPWQKIFLHNIEENRQVYLLHKATDEKILEMQKEMERIQEENSSLEKHISYLYENTMTYGNLKRKLKKKT